jgi:uncharacterized protein (DUF427 family)
MSKESVRDYPRPPKVEPTKRIRVEFAGETVADTSSHPNN